ITISNGATLKYFSANTSWLPLGNTISGTGNLIFEGTGVASVANFGVSQNNSGFSGPTTITNARVWLTHGNGLGTGAVTIGSGAGLTVENVTFSNAISVAGLGWNEGTSYGAIRLSGTTGVVSGPVTMTDNARIAVMGGSIGTVSGVISGTNKNLEKYGTGGLYLTGANNFSGTYQHNGGVTILNSTSGPALFNGTSGTLIIGNTVGNAGPGSATWRGDWYSTVEIYRTNQLGTNVNVQFNPTAGNAYLVLRGSDTLIGNLSGTNNGGPAIIENVEGDTGYGTGRLTVTQTTNASFTGYVRDGNWNGSAGGLALTKNGAATLTINGIDSTGYVNYTGGTVVNEGRLILRNTATGGNFTNNNAFVEFRTDGSNIQLSNGTLSGNGTYVKTGANSLFLGANGQTENISLAAGGWIDVQQGTMRNEYTAGNWSNNLGSLNIAAGALVDMWDSAGGITVDRLTGAGILAGGLNGNRSLTVGVANGSGTFGGALTNFVSNVTGQTGGILNLVKRGTGTQTLSGSGSNNYTGFTRVEAGTLAAGTNNVFSANSVVTLSNAAAVTLDLFGFNNSIGGLAGGGSTGGEVKLGAGILTLGWVNGNDGYSGLISGTGSLIKVGSGTQTLMAANTFTGGARVNSGTLAIGVAEALGTGSLTLASNNATVSTLADMTVTNSVVINGAGVVNTGTNRVNSTGTISGAGSLNKQGTGTLVLSGSNSFSGGSFLNAGTLSFGSTDA
ncbi:MAG: hypothetical protein EBV83_08555, partial [Verrucomicrobia bacterium]|nr:hypothetical protein [Verrucomicrobiota bacterium]